LIRHEKNLVGSDKILFVATFLILPNEKPIFLENISTKDDAARRYFSKRTTDGATFKFYSDRVIFNAKKIQFALDEFQFWHNAIRPHRHLNGLTPNEQWNAINPYERLPKRIRKVSFWNGLLTGYLLDYK